MTTKEPSVNELAVAAIIENFFDHGWFEGAVAEACQDAARHTLMEEAEERQEIPSPIRSMSVIGAYCSLAPHVAARLRTRLLISEIDDWKDAR